MSINLTNGEILSEDRTITNFRVTHAAIYGAVKYKFQLGQIDERDDRFSLFVDGAFIVGGLTDYQSGQLLGYTQRMEDRAKEVMDIFREFERDIPLEHSENVVKFFNAFNNLFKDKP